MENIGKYFKGLECLEDKNEGEIGMEIKIKYFNEAKELEINPKGNCIDVYANEDVFIPFMGYAMIPLGFALNLPKGMTGRLMPRSSTFKTWGCIETNSVGMIDDTYVGNDDQWFLPVQCTMAKVTEKVVIEGKKVTCMGTWIHKGDKIAQFEIVNAMKMPQLIKVEDFGEVENRGGFGSTGKR